MSQWCDDCYRKPYSDCNEACPIFGLNLSGLAKKYFEPKNVYIILYGKERSISREVYDLYDKAVEFIQNRSYSPQKVNTWLWIDSCGSEYQIVECSVK